MRGSKAKVLRKIAEEIPYKKKVDYNISFVKPSNKTIRNRIDLFKKGILTSTESIARKVPTITLKEDCLRYLYKNIKYKYKKGLTIG